MQKPTPSEPAIQEIAKWIVKLADDHAKGKPLDYEQVEYGIKARLWRIRYEAMLVELRALYKMFAATGNDPARFNEELLRRLRIYERDLAPYRDEEDEKAL